MATGWGEPDFKVERVIDEFGVCRPTPDFLLCSRICLRVAIDRLPYNYYVNSINRQPANAFFGKVTVFADGYLRETHEITHEYIEIDLDTDLLALNDAYLGINCRLILGITYLWTNLFAFTLVNPGIAPGLLANGTFREYLNKEDGVELPDDLKRFPTPFIAFPRFDEIRVKFIEPTMRGKLTLVGWKADSKKTCCSSNSEDPPPPPDEPPKDPPDEEPPAPPDEPDSNLPPPDPPYDGGTDDGRTKPPPSEPPTGEPCALYTVTIRIRFGASSDFREQDEIAQCFGEIGGARIVGTFPPGNNVELQCRGNATIGQECGEFQYYPFTGFSGIEMDSIVSVTIA